MAGMNRQLHLIIGIAAFLVYFYAAGLFHAPAGAVFVFGLVAVSAGSLFPDLVEPATSARHRGIFHSLRALKLVCLAFLVSGIGALWYPGVPRPALLFAASCFFLGWALHLLADSLTRAGLPG